MFDYWDDPVVHLVLLPKELLRYTFVLRISTSESPIGNTFVDHGGGHIKKMATLKIEF